MARHNDARVTAQVAVEAITNCYGDGYDLSTMQAVRAFAVEQGVGDFYLDPLRILIADLS